MKMSEFKSCVGFQRVADLAADAAERTQRVATEQLQKLREQILAGETTGDSILDVSITWHGLCRASTIQKVAGVYKEFEDLFSLHSGGLFLVVAAEPQGSGGFADVQETFYLGRIKPGKLMVSASISLCEFPVAPFVQFSWIDSPTRDPKRVITPRQVQRYLSNKDFDLANLNLPLTPKGTQQPIVRLMEPSTRPGSVFGLEGGEKYYWLEACFGEQAIHEWFGKHGPYREKILLALTSALEEAEAKAYMVG